MKTPLKFLSSVLAGVSLGMLFAPKKGTELRKELTKSSDKMGDFGKQLLKAGEDASTEVKKFLRKKEVRELIESGKTQFSDLLELAKEKGSDLSIAAKKELQSLGEELAGKAQKVKKTVVKKGKSVRKTVAKKATAVKKGLKN